ncbi:MAG: hypothetical protein Q6354_05665, partial [Candidatus Brocadiales bacterium]|nr:hypothetical protein [Candidatus Brocadiales bacterium]
MITLLGGAESREALYGPPCLCREGHAEGGFAYGIPSPETVFRVRMPMANLHGPPSLSYQAGLKPCTTEIMIDRFQRKITRLRVSVT